MKKVVILIFMVILCGFSLTFSASQTLYADSVDENQTKLEQNVSDVIGSLDFDDYDKIISDLSKDEQNIFDGDSFKTKVEKLINGDYEVNFLSILSLIFSFFVDSFKSVVPSLCLVAVISIVSNLLMQSKSSNSSKSVGDIVHFACFALIVMIVFGLTKQVIELSQSAVVSIKSQMEITFPILLTLMASVGGGVSVGIFQPLVAVLSGGLITIFETIILPLFIFSVVFNVVGNLSSNVKLNKFVDIFNTIFKTLIGFVFTLFTAFLAIQGISAGSYDGLSVKTAKFAIKSYVPFLGGYISDGFSFIITSSILVKNAVGMAGLLLLLCTILKPIAIIVSLKISLSLLGGVLQPVADKRVCDFVSSVAKSLNMLIATLVGIAFAYLITVGLIMCCSNLAL